MKTCNLTTLIIIQILNATFDCSVLALKRLITKSLQENISSFNLEKNVININKKAIRNNK